MFFFFLSFSWPFLLYSSKSLLDSFHTSFLHSIFFLFSFCYTLFCIVTTHFCITSVQGYDELSTLSNFVPSASFFSPLISHHFSLTSTSYPDLGLTREGQLHDWFTQLMQWNMSSANFYRSEEYKCLLFSTLPSPPSLNLTLSLHNNQLQIHTSHLHLHCTFLSALVPFILLSLYHTTH